MIVVENFPLFRSQTPVAAVGVVAKAPEPASTEAIDLAGDFAPTGYDGLPYGDLTSWVGQTIDSDTWQGLQEECCRRYGNGFVFTAVPMGNGWRVRRLATAGCGCPRGAVDGQK